LSLTTISALIRPPVWSPSGAHIALPVANYNGDYLLIVDAANGDQERHAIPGGNGLFGLDWITDDELILNVLMSQGSPTQCGDTRWSTPWQGA
jgi:hypothetical protein